MALVKSETVQLVHDISVVYTPQMGSTIITLLDNNSACIRSKFGLENVKGSCYGLLDEFRCYASITSLPDVALPDFNAEQTESERVVLAQSYEWNTARFECVVYRKARNSLDWAEVGASSLKNAGGFRYRIHRLLDLLTDNIGAKVGENGKIGVSIKSVGYGYPESFDRITFTGSWTQEFVYTQEHPTYVVINQYGSSPSPSPSPTPTPVVVPTFTLSYANSGATTAIANTDEKLKLTITDIPNNTQLNIKWYKVANAIDTDTTLMETIAATGSQLEISTLKFRDKGSGNYRFKLTYNGYEYTSSTVSITVNPEISTSPASGETAANTQITVSGKYLTGASSRKYTYSWLKAGGVIYTSAEATLTLDSAGAFTLTVGLNTLQNQSSGTYQFRLNLDSDNLNNIKFIEATNTVTVTVTQPQVPTVTVSPANVDSYTSNVGTTNFTIEMKDMPYTSGDLLLEEWFKVGNNTAVNSNYLSYSPDSTGKQTFTRPGSYFYGTEGTYICKISKWGSSTKYTSNNIIVGSSSGGLG